MTSKIYTAQDLRDFANDINQYGLAGVCMGKRGNRSGNTIAAMLRQAAVERERAEEVRSRHSLYYGKIDYEHETAIVDEIDYILRGDSGKEDK